MESRRPGRADVQKSHRPDLTSRTSSSGLNLRKAARGTLSDPEIARLEANTRAWMSFGTGTAVLSIPSYLFAYYVDM